MPRVRVFVVDDSVTIRRLVSDTIASDPALEVAGTAPNGRIALAKIRANPPDVVTLDVEMPDMDGLETLVELRKTHPKLPVVMFSSSTEMAATTTLEALSRGATDYVTKPRGTGTLDASLKVLRAELLPKLRTLGGAKVAEDFPLQPAVARAPARTADAKTSGYMAMAPVPALLAIGASTGGPNAIADLFGGMPGPPPVPVILTQHMPPIFTRLFAQRLDRTLPFRVREAEEGDTLVAGTVLIAPGDRHLVLRSEGGKTVVRLDDGPHENSCRPAVDPMFRSATAIFGARILAVVLTGMGQDGLRGAELVREVGGQIVVQDEASSVVWGMPGFIARAGLADAVLPLPMIAGEIMKRLAPRTSAQSFDRVNEVSRGNA